VCLRGVVSRAETHAEENTEDTQIFPAGISNDRK
jgi:hypothetical protein